MLMAQGAELLLYGMGTVIVFLSLLVLATGLMSRAVLRWFPEPEMAEAGAATRGTGSSPTPASSSRIGAAVTRDSPAVQAAIAAAIHHHRGKRS